MDDEVRSLLREVAKDPSDANKGRLQVACGRAGHGPFKLVFVNNGHSGTIEYLSIAKVCATCGSVIQGGCLGDFVPGSGGKRVESVEIDL